MANAHRVPSCLPFRFGFEFDKNHHASKRVVVSGKESGKKRDEKCLLSHSSGRRFDLTGLLYFTVN
jgi:hypothetical protein